MYWWKGRQPAAFSEKNVTVKDGQLHLTMRKEKLSPELEKQGYRDYTSAALHTKARSSYGYYEVRARPMNSAGSSSFWFQQDSVAGFSTEIDVFEIGGKARDYERKYNMAVHVFRTPQEKRHWQVNGVGRAMAAGGRLPRLWFGLVEGGNPVLRGWRAGPHGAEHALAPAAVFDLRQRDDARMVWHAAGCGSALDVFGRLRAGVEEARLKAAAIRKRGSGRPRSSRRFARCRRRICNRR
jgi:hypothetical protein